MEREGELPGNKKKPDGFKGVVTWDTIKKKELQRNVSHLFECVCFMLISGLMHNTSKELG